MGVEGGNFMYTVLGGLGVVALLELLVLTWLGTLSIWLGVRLTQVYELQRNYLQVTHELKSALVDAVFANDTNKSREERVNQHLTTLITRLADIAEPNRIPKGYKVIPPEMVVGAGGPGATTPKSTSTREPRAPFFPGLDDIPPAAMSEGLVKRLHGIRLQRRQEDDEAGISTSSEAAAAVMPTPSGT